MSSDGSDTAAGGQAPATRRRGGRIVQSRYLQYDKKNTKKVLGPSSSGVAQRRAEKDASSSFSSSSFSSSSFSSSSTSLSSSGTKAKSVLSQKHESSADVGHSSLNQSSFEKGDLESTLLDEGKVNQSDLDISTISDKTDLKKSFHSESALEEDSDAISITGETDEETDTDDPVAELESETLLLTYLRIMAEKNVAKMEEKAEKNLLMLCEEKQRQQEKLWELKREILLKEREQQLNETLDKQIEVLSPLVAVCEQFKEQYKSFADALDATRHELPIKNIHIEGDKQAYLDELGKQLTITQELLTEIMPNHSEESAKPLSALKELKEVSQQLNKELQRSFTDVQNLAFEASKEVSLHNQYVCEENHGVDVVKSWYFN